MNLLVLLLEVKTEPAPWWVEWLTLMPGWVVGSIAILYALFLLLRKPLESFIQSLFDQFADRMKSSSKQPATELARKAKKAITLEQIAERLRLESRCDHVSLYAVQNGEYLRTGEGVEKFSMQAESARPGDQRYMDTERLLYASDIPRLVLALENQPYVLLWRNHCDDWKANKIMFDRDYTSAVLAFIRRPGGVIGMFALNWRETEIFRADQLPLPASHEGPVRRLDTDLEQIVREYATEFSFTM